ncbi:MAG: deoxyribonuclease IV [Acidimicrobiales bacterium]
MHFGAHVSAAGGLLPAIDRAADIGATVIQVHTQSPRAWKPNAYSEELLSSFADRVAVHPSLLGTVCHASYLINLASADPELLDKSRACLVKNIEVATQMGASGLVLHLGSHLGRGFRAVASAVALEVVRALDTAMDLLDGPSCRLLIENTAGAGGTIGRTYSELAHVIESAGDDSRLGVCLDTQHLFASGVSFETLDQADDAVMSLEKEVGLERLYCLHVNDSKVPLGSNRDRHENLGEGFIGRRGLGSLLAHPRLQHLPAILEVPGPTRDGPTASDLDTARAIHAAGRRRWQERERKLASTPQPRRAPRRAQGGQTGSRPSRPPAGSP